ncbi:hypothetical protein HMI54_007739 [Coelomomyces lativittatus]|nr:hypothetical protein HMI54_007739 [Coelomomyces lativittatus]
MGLGLSGIFVSSIYGVYALLSMSGKEAEKWLEHPEWGWRVWCGLPLLPWIFIATRIEVFDQFLPLLPLWLLDIRSFQLTWPPSPTTFIILLPWVRHLYNRAYLSLTEKVLIPLVIDAPSSSSSSSSSSSNTSSSDSLSQEERTASQLQALAEIQSTERLDIARHVVGALAIPGRLSSSCLIYILIYI